MKTSIRIGMAMAAVFAAAAVNAQGLGGLTGGATGGLTGSMSGGLRDMSVMTQGNGSLAGELRTDRLRRTADGAGGSLRSVRERTRSAVEETGARTQAVADRGVDAARGASDQAKQVDAAGQIETTASAAGSLTPGEADASAVSSLTGSMAGSTAPAEGSAPATPAGTQDTAAVGGALTSAVSRSTDGSAQPAPSSGDDQPGTPLASTLGASGGGSAQGSASASRDGLALDGGVDGSASVEK